MQARPPAALREAEEEITLERRLVEPIGYLDVHITPTGYRIVPTLARVGERYLLRVNRDEVEEAFEVPLAFLMATQNHQHEKADWNGLITMGSEFTSLKGRRSTLI